MYIYVNKIYGNKIAWYATTLFIFSTEQIYFLSVYTESVFIFLLLLFLILIQNNKYFLSSVVVGILSATKFVGFLLILIIVYQYLKNCLNNKNINQIKSAQVIKLLWQKIPL
jgi:Gpi18-like mannosyltransferase